MARKAMRWLVALVSFGVAVPAFAQDITFSAAVDKTMVKVGEPIILTVTLSGDIAGIELPAFQFPDGFSVGSRSQSTNFSLRAGAMERSVSLSYALIPQQEGVFELGPFHLEHHGETVPTEPIEITVEKSTGPPPAPSGTRRFLL